MGIGSSRRSGGARLWTALAAFLSCWKEVVKTCIFSASVEVSLAAFSARYRRSWLRFICVGYRLSRHAADSLIGCIFSHQQEVLAVIFSC